MAAFPFSLSPFCILTLSEEGWKNLNIFEADGRLSYTVQTMQSGRFTATPTSTILSRMTKGGSNDVLAIIEWGGKKSESVITYKGKKCELRELLPPKEWHSRKVFTLSGVWNWSTAGEEPPELFDSERRSVVRYKRNFRYFKKSDPNTLEIDQRAIDCLGIDMVVAGWVVMMHDAEKQPPVYD